VGTPDRGHPYVPKFSQVPSPGSQVHLGSSRSKVIGANRSGRGFYGVEPEVEPGLRGISPGPDDGGFGGMSGGGGIGYVV